MRRCDDECGILAFIPDGEDCPIVEMKQKRKDGAWWIKPDGKEIYPLCEDKIVRVAKKKRRMLT